MVRGTVTFITGGVRSGKSAFAEKYLVEQANRSVGRLVYIATGVALDEEMKKRIALHKEQRLAQQWVTIEQSTAFASILPFIQQGDYVLWDCVTTWLANELYDGWKAGTPCLKQSGCIEQKVQRLVETLQALQSIAEHIVIVSNEVLDDWIPSDEESQLYAKTLGTLHQKLVAFSDEAIEMEFGIPEYWKRK